jgi:hypothetical protein
MKFVIAVLAALFFVLPASAQQGGCGTAARLGGPCGCIAMSHVGLTDRKFWLVSNWYAFPRTQCHPGAAALWGTRHVEIVSSCDGNVATTIGPYGVRRTSMNLLAFVTPGGGGRYAPAPQVYASRQEARVRYARTMPRQRYASRYPRGSYKVASNEQWGGLGWGAGH